MEDAANVEIWGTNGFLLKRKKETKPMRAKSSNEFKNLKNQLTNKQ